MRNFILKIYLFTFVFGWAGSSLPHRDFLWLQCVGATLRCCGQTSHGGSFSCCRAQALGAGFSNCSSQALEHTSSVVVVHGLSCSSARGIITDQGLNPSPLHWQVDSYPLQYQGSPQFNSVAQSCPTLVTPWTVAQQASLSITDSQSLLKLMSIESVMPSNHLILCHIPFSSHLQSFPASRSFPMSQFFASGGQSIGVSASASILPMNTQDGFPLGLTGWISCSPRDSQESSPTLQFKRIKSLVLGFLYSPTLTSIHDYWKNIALTRWTFVGKVMSLLFIWCLGWS